MKKIAMFMSALALAFAFTSCEEKPDNGGNLDNVTEDGFYVAGPATGATELTADYMMAAGLNEVDGANRSGMYEKYIALEANKDFELVLYANGEQIRYGAALEAFDVSEKADNPRDVEVKRGVLVTGADAPAMKVTESGLYHIVLDLNEANDLAFGAQIVLAPVQWGVRGAMNGWGFTAMPTPKFNQTTMTYVLENCSVASTGAFKFAYGAGWKLDLDDAGKVKANTNLGIDAEAAGELGDNALVPNGKDINIARGIYKITLTWTLKGGAIKNGYTATIEKTGTLEAVDYSNCQMELVGAGVAEQTGSSADTAWSWGQVLLASNDGKPAKNGDVYTWTWSNVQLTTDGWKIRTLNAAETGGVASFDLGADKIDTANSVEGTSTSGDIILAAAGKYNVTLAIDAAADTKTITIVAAE
ncbi:MAG: hypothetical protein IKB85_06175 [Bacteroidales bacterium]|nr:hypothetical protein [Bacteroidales bacterium]